MKMPFVVQSDVLRCATAGRPNGRPGASIRYKKKTAERGKTVLGLKNHCPGTGTCFFFKGFGLLGFVGRFWDER